MKNKNRSLVTIVMSIILVALVVFVFIPKMLSDFLLGHRYLAIGIGFVALITCCGYMIISAKTVTEENFVVDNDVLFDGVTTDVVEEKVVEEVTEETPIEEVAVVDAPKVEATPEIVRLDYSFKSKLILSSDEVKDYYNSIVTHATSFGVKVRKSWKKETIYLGRKVFAILTFKGKKLCVSFALDPKDYENSKYFFKDVSEVKKFEKTPLLMKITSGRKVKYTKDLLNLIFTNNGLEDKKIEVSVENIPTETKEELLEKGLIKDPTKEKVNA